MGGSDSKDLMHNFIINNGLAFDNKSKGFDQNSNKGSMIIYNGTAYRNGGNNYSIPSALSSGKTATIINSAALGITGSIASFVIQQTNSWMNPFVVTSEDFISIDTSGVTGARNADGSLPDISFMHLAETSDLINSGTDVGLLYAGTAPDIGAFEYSPVVPVELLSFNGEVSGNSVILKWITATETNNLGFEIQAAFAKGEYRPVGFIPGAGSSSERIEYSFEHKNAYEGINWYRIKQVDFDGSFTYSDEVSVSIAPSEFVLEQNYPNPFNPISNFEFRIPQGRDRSSDFGMVTLKIVDALGRDVVTILDEEMEPGYYKIGFDASDLASGVYYYTLTAGEFSTTKKMVVLK